MKLTDFTTGLIMEIAADSIIEFHNRGLFREVKTGLNGVCETKYKVTDSIPQIMDKIREEKTS